MNLRRSSAATSVGLVGLTCWLAGGYADARTDVCQVAANAKLNDTVRRYFCAVAGLATGDLIVSSQVEELQDYLRCTWGRNLMTSPRVLRRVTADKAALSRMFHSSTGKPIILKVAKELGGYAQIDQLCRTSAGRTLLETAICQ